MTTAAIEAATAAAAQGVRNAIWVAASCRERGGEARCNMSPDIAQEKYEQADDALVGGMEALARAWGAVEAAAGRARRLQPTSEFYIIVKI